MNVPWSLPEVQSSMIRTLALSQHGHHASNKDPPIVLVQCFWEVEFCQHEPHGHNEKFPFPRPGEKPSLSGSKQPSCLLSTLIRNHGSCLP